MAVMAVRPVVHVMVVPSGSIAAALLATSLLSECMGIFLCSIPLTFQCLPLRLALRAFIGLCFGFDFSFSPGSTLKALTGLRLDHLMTTEASSTFRDVGLSCSLPSPLTGYQF